MDCNPIDFDGKFCKFTDLWSRTLRIDFRDRSFEISTGQMLVVPKGIEHKPFAEKICELILFEPENTLNTGDRTNDRTVDTIDWI